MNLVARNNFFDFDRFLRDSWPQVAESRAAAFFTPRVDIQEAENHYEITAELPGVDKEDIQVHVKDGVLTLEAESAKEEEEKSQGKVIRRERRYGKFKRSFNLGADVQESDIKASFKNGVLTLEAAKVAEKEPEPLQIAVH